MGLVQILLFNKYANGWSAPQTILPQAATHGLVVWKYEPDSAGDVRFYGRDLTGNLIYAYWHNNVATLYQTPINLKLYEYYFGDAAGDYYIYRIGEVPVPGGTTTGVYSQCIDTNLNFMAGATFVWRE